MIHIIEVLLISISIITNFFLAFVIFWRKRSVRTNVLFAIVAVCFGVWGLCLLFYEHPIILSSLYWLRGAYMSATGMELGIVAFTFLFPRPSFRKIWPFATVYGALFVATSFYYLFFTNQWIVDVQRTATGLVQATLGPFYIYWTLGEWVLIFLSVYILFSNYLKEKSYYKVQLQYLLIGFFLFGILVNIPDVVMPLFFHTTRFFGISSLLSLIFTGTVSYIILKHRFMDLQRVLRQVGYYTLAIGGLSTLYFIVAYVIGVLFFPGQFYLGYTLVAVVVVVCVRFLITPLRNFLSKNVKRMFIKGLYEKEDVLNELNNLVTESIQLHTVIGRTLEILYKTFLPKFSTGLSILDGKTVILKTYPRSKNKSLHFSQDEIALFEGVHDITLRDELEKSPLKDILIEKHIAVVLPFHAEGWKRFALLGDKQSGDVYYSYDVSTLTLIQPMLRLLGQHVRQVEEIRDFNRRLKTEIRKATQDLRLSYKHLKLADKLKDEFISIASHELKTPTTAIQGFLWLVLQKDKSLSEYSRSKLERVAQLTNHITSLVNDMLDVSKIESNRISLIPEAFDIRHLAQEIKGELDLFALQKSLRIHVVGRKEYKVWADKRRIRQVLSNLMNNAVKYTPHGGNITVSFVTKDQEIITVVEDTGIGIRKEDLPKLFTKFGKLDSENNAHANFPGTGLGLYITKNLITLSKGNIFVDSTYGKGTKFTFILPAR